MYNILVGIYIYSDRNGCNMKKHGTTTSIHCRHGMSVAHNGQQLRAHIAILGFFILEKKKFDEEVKTIINRIYYYIIFSSKNTVVFKRPSRLHLYNMRKKKTSARRCVAAIVRAVNAMAVADDVYS